MPSQLRQRAAPERRCAKPAFEGGPLRQPAHRRSLAQLTRDNPSTTRPELASKHLLLNRVNTSKHLSIPFPPITHHTLRALSMCLHVPAVRAHPTTLIAPAARARH
jgi:hypothetical protein